MQQIVQALQGLGLKQKGKQWQCPWHDDKNPSASVIQGDDGNWRLYCHACGKRGDIHDILGTDFKQERKTEMGYGTLEELTSGLSNVVNVHRYVKGGKVISAAIRIEVNGKKEFRQASLNGKWQMKAPPKPSTLYNYDGIKDSPVVVVVEGEKAADALIHLRFPATTSAGGASNAKGADWSVLNGKNIILWPDNDGPGRSYMKQVESIIDAKVKWCEPDLPEKGDAWDFVNNAEQVNKLLGEDSKEMVRLMVRDELGDARGKGGFDGMKAHLEGCISGDNLPIDFTHDLLSEQTQALLPGTVTLLCGDPCAGKSFLVMDWLLDWAKNGIKVAAFFLEDGKDEFHLPRALAMASGETGIIKRKWVNTHPDETRQAMQEHKDILEVIDSYIDDAPDRQETMDSLILWMEKKATNNRILVVDPVTILSEGSDKKWIADAKFVMAAKDIARRHRCSVLFVTHPKSGIGGQFSLEALAGGAAYPRFSHTVLWLEHHDKKTVTVGMPTCMGYTKDEVEINKTLHLMKARNGEGSGLQIGLTFHELTFTEHGIVCKKDDTI